MGQLKSKSYYSEEDLEECLIQNTSEEKENHLCIDFNALETNEDIKLSTNEDEFQDTSTLEDSTPSVCSMEKLALLIYIVILALYQFL